MRLFLTQQGLRGAHYGITTDSHIVPGTKLVKNTATVTPPRVRAEDADPEIPSDLIGNYYF